MSLIRGCLGKCPCPICLVLLDELHDLAKSFQPQSQDQAKAALDAWLEDRHKGEEILKGLGLRPISVRDVLWFNNSSCWAEHFVAELISWF